jgi:hypothetical protein
MIKLTDILNLEKYNLPLMLHEHLWHTINEITLNPSNAVEIFGDINNGKFQVGDIIYTYDIKQVNNPYDKGQFYNIQFHPVDNKTSIPTGTSNKENYIKILNTMYKIILDFANEVEPEYIGISSMDNDGSKNYHTVYNNLTKSNNIPGYTRKNSNLEFMTPQGKGRFIVLKQV